jgi:hypothetical protein
MPPRSQLYAVHRIRLIMRSPVLCGAVLHEARFCSGFGARSLRIIRQAESRDACAPRPLPGSAQRDQTSA